MDVLRLQRTEISIAFLLGTIASSFLLSKAGKYFDLWGARIMIPVASVFLSISVVFISLLDKIISILEASSLISFVLITLGYFGARLFGQGILTSCSRNVLLVWFERQRGLVIGIRNLFVTFGFAIAPMAIGNSISLWGSRDTMDFSCSLRHMFLFDFCPFYSRRSRIMRLEH